MSIYAYIEEAPVSFGVRLATTLAVGCGFWCASHLYQRWRYAALEHEDKSMLQAQPSDAERDKWIGAVKREALNYGVNPSTLISLGDAGDVDAELSRHGDTGAHARRYNPPLPSEILLVYPYLLASWTGSLISIPYAVFLAASVALGQEDMRFRIAPVLMLLVFAAAGALSFPLGALCVGGYRNPPCRRVCPDFLCHEKGRRGQLACRRLPHVGHSAHGGTFCRNRI